MLKEIMRSIDIFDVAINMSGLMIKMMMMMMMSDSSFKFVILYS
jgi:glycopeptide antibiotics resistance protein